MFPTFMVWLQSLLPFANLGNWNPQYMLSEMLIQLVYWGVLILWGSNMNSKHKCDLILLSTVSSLCVLCQIILSHWVANLLGRFRNFNICQTQIGFKAFSSSLQARPMAPGAWNGKEIWLGVEVCSVCVYGDSGSRIPVFSTCSFSRSNSSDAESWEGE